MASRLGIDGPRIFEAFNLDSSFYDCIAMGGQFQVFKHTEFGYDGRGGSHIVKRVCPMLYKNKTPNSLRDLRLEVQVLAQQVVRRHPNIIDLIAWGYDYPHPEALCSMDNFFHSPDFDAAENLSWNTRCHLAIGVAAGLECLHKIEVLHNDLKPGNILICRQDNQSAPFTSKLADFGMSVTEAKSFREYGRTQGWRPPEARDYESRKHGKFSNEVLFKSESFAYGLVAIYAICCGPRQIQHLSEDQDERQACTLELLSSQPSFSIEDKSEALAFYSAVEQNFLLEHPEDRKRVSPQTLELSVSVRNDCSKASNLAASRTRPHDAMSFYRNRGSTLLRDLERADVDTYPGDLLFEMAVAKGVDFDPRHGIDYDGMLKLVNKSTKTKVPSLAGTGVVAQIFSAFTSSTRPPPLIAQRDLVAALHTAVSSGSISARATLGDIAPQLLPGAMNAFQSYGAYNRESLLIRQDFDDLVSFPLADLDDAALIRKVSSLPAMRSTHNTDLHIAALLGKHKLIRMLIDKPGVNIDSPNAAGETPLYKACLAGQYESARVLLENGANPCVRVSPLEISCLHWLFAFPCHQMENVLSLLVAKGLEINARVLPANETTPKRYSWTGSLHFPFHWPAG
ncbi:kinase-like protein, partial [Plenodomus tracheiphilus IPT5]